MKRRDFINLSASVALLSCSKESSPIEPVLEESDLRSAAFVLEAQTQATIEGQLPNDGGDHVGRLITITDAAGVASDHCGLSWTDYVCTVSDPDGGTPLTRTCSLPETLDVVLADQFDILSQRPCDGQLELQLTRIVSDKITICHVRPGDPSEARTIKLSKKAAQAHLDHGDHLGPCL